MPISTPIPQKKMTALYYRMMQYQPENLALLKNYFTVCELDTPKNDSKELLSQAHVCFAPLGYQVTQQKIDQMPKLKAIVSNTTGVPHIDNDYAQKQGIHVLSLKDEHEFLNSITPTAEHTIGLLLALTRKTVASFHSVKLGDWNRRPFGAEAMLSRLTIGIIGYGRLGRMVAHYARAFGMNVLYTDLKKGTNTDRNHHYIETLYELVQRSDVITLHVPANENTHHLIDNTCFQNFKKGSFFINTSRGEIIDEEALLNQLKNGHIAGAALDVLDGEFVPGFNSKSHPLVNYASTHDNLLITPHIGGSSKDAWLETERYVIKMAIERLYG